MASSDLSHESSSDAMQAPSSPSQGSLNQTPLRMTQPAVPDAPRRRGWEVLFNTDDGSWSQVAGATTVTDSEVRNLMESFNRMGDPLVTSYPRDLTLVQAPIPTLPTMPLPDTCPPFSYSVDERNGKFVEVVTDRRGRVVFEAPCVSVDTDASAEFDIQEKVQEGPESNEFYFDFGHLKDEEGNQLTLTGQRVRRCWSEEACRVIRDLCGRRAWELSNKMELPLYIYESYVVTFSEPCFRQKTCAGLSDIIAGNSGDMCPAGPRQQHQPEVSFTYYHFGTEYVLLPMGLTQSERRRVYELGFYPWLEMMFAHTGCGSHDDDDDHDDTPIASGDSAVANTVTHIQLPPGIDASSTLSIPRSRTWFDIVGPREGVPDNDPEMFDRVMRLPWPYQETAELRTWDGDVVPAETVVAKDWRKVLRMYVEALMRAYTAWSGIRLPPLTEETLLLTGSDEDVETQRLLYITDYNPSTGRTGELLGDFELPPGIPLSHRRVLYEAVKSEQKMLPWRKAVDGTYRTVEGTVVPEGTSLSNQYSLWCDDQRLRDILYHSPPPERCELLVK
jgi:hypothetical protein